MQQPVGDQATVSFTQGPAYEGCTSIVVGGKGYLRCPELNCEIRNVMEFYSKLMQLSLHTQFKAFCDNSIPQVDISFLPTPFHGINEHGG